MESFLKFVLDFWFFIQLKRIYWWDHILMDFSLITNEFAMRFISLFFLLERRDHTLFSLFGNSLFKWGTLASLVPSLKGKLCDFFISTDIHIGQRLFEHILSKLILSFYQQWLSFALLSSWNRVYILVPAFQLIHLHKLKNAFKQVLVKRFVFVEVWSLFVL